jgi:autotransporter-associated beta strand protein
LGVATGTKTITNSAGTAAVFTINNATDNASGNVTGANNIILTGNMGLTKQGAGTLTLRGTNTYSGATTVSQGTLAVTANATGNSAPVSIGNAATLNVTGGGFAMGANQTVTGTGATGSLTTTPATGVITAGNNTISSSGTLTLTRLSVLGTGNQITGGDIQSGGSGGNQRGLLIGNGAIGTLTITGGTLTSNGGNDISRYDVLANTAAAGGPVATLNISGGSYVNSSGRTTLGNAGTVAGTAIITLTSGSATINELEYLMGTFAGNTATVNLDGGTLTTTSIINTTGANKVFNFNGGQFVAGGAVSTIGTPLAPTPLTLNVRDGGALINTNGNSLTVIDGLLNAGTGGLTKSGLGTLTLGGTNTYTGATTVSSGTLTVNGSVATGSAVTVAAGATLNGTGSALGPVTINGSISGTGVFGATTVNANGILTPGNSPGIVSFSSLSLGNDSKFVWELTGNTDAGRGVNFDGVDVTGTSLNIASGADSDLVFDSFGSTVSFADPFWDTDRQWLVFDNANVPTVTPSVFGTPNIIGTPLQLAELAGRGSFAWATGTGLNPNDIVLNFTAVPEPSTLALLTVAIVGGGLYRRSRNQKKTAANA